MQINGKLDLKSTDLILKEHGIGAGQALQMYVDNECIKLMGKYTPFQSGTLERSAILNTVIGSGLIVQDTPYARYLYYGEVFAPNLPIRGGKISFDPADGEIERWVSPPHKYPTGRPLHYSTAGHPLAGKMWFERMKADYKDAILAGCQELLRRLGT